MKDPRLAAAGADCLPMLQNKGKFKARILDATAMQRILTRIAHEILERNPNMETVVLIGMGGRGGFLSKRLSQIMKEIEGKPVATGAIDIASYRDDLTQIEARPRVKKLEIPFDLNGKTVVLVDDVLYTGRTIRAALDSLTSHGSPKTIQAAVLIDRGHRELPIHADYVGKNVPTASDEIVRVMLKEIDKEDQVLITEKE
jgi:pyrimidine operon attenuation protein / uracil phosphoribosyltransferase